MRRILKLLLFFAGVTAAVFLLLFRFVLPGRAARRWRNFVQVRLSRFCCWILGLEKQVFGKSPSAPFILVANHLSYIDVILLASEFPAVFVAKKEVSRWPFFGAVAALFDTIFLDRENLKDIPQTAERMKVFLESGQSIVFFPEGTSSGGDEIKVFRPSLLNFAAECGYPVHYAFLRYYTPVTEAPAAQAVCWWGAMDFLPHFWNLFRLRKFQGVIRFGEAPVCSDNRKDLAQKLYQAVEVEFLAEKKG